MTLHQHQAVPLQVLGWGCHGNGSCKSFPKLEHDRKLHSLRAKQVVFSLGHVPVTLYKAACMRAWIQDNSPERKHCWIAQCAPQGQILIWTRKWTKPHDILAIISECAQVHQFKTGALELPWCDQAATGTQCNKLSGSLSGKEHIAYSILLLVWGKIRPRYQDLAKPHRGRRVKIPIPAVGTSTATPIRKAWNKLL